MLSPVSKTGYGFQAPVNTLCTAFLGSRLYPVICGSISIAKPKACSERPFSVAAVPAALGFSWPFTPLVMAKG